MLACVKWLCDKQLPSCTQASKPQNYPEGGKGRCEKIANGLETPSHCAETHRLLQNVGHPPCSGRDAGRSLGFGAGLTALGGPLAARASPSSLLSYPQRAPERRPQAWAEQTPAPRARPKTPPRGRRDLPARVPASPVIHVRNTHPHEGQGGGRTTKPNPKRPRGASRWGRGARGPTGPGGAARQMSAPGVGVSAAAGEATPRGRRTPGGVGEPAAGGQAWARRGRRVPRRCARPRPPPPARGAVPLLTRREAAGSARAVSAAGLRGQEAPPHRGREGRWAGGARFPTSVLRRLRLALLPRRKLARSLGRGGRAGGRAESGYSAASGGRGGRMRRGGGGGHAEPAGLGPGPGTRRLRGGGGWVSG